MMLLLGMMLMMLLLLVMLFKISEEIARVIELFIEFIR